MDDVYENTDNMGLKSASKDKCSQSQVVLGVVSVCLLFALGSVCILGVLLFYAIHGGKSTNDALTEQHPENWCSKSAIDNELLQIYNRYKTCLSSCTDCSSVCKPCEDGWTAYRGKCYFFSSVKQTWFESRDSCESSGAHLVVINSKEIQEILVSKIQETHWIGLNDQKTEGLWVWMNGQTLNETRLTFWYINKANPEPDNSPGNDISGEDCACLGYETSYLNFWFDASCTYFKKKYICEKPYSFTIATKN